MKKITVILALVLGLMVNPAWAGPQTVTINLPETVVEQAIQKILPFTVTNTSESLAGLISIEKIDNLRFADQSVAGAIAMAGRDVRVNTEIAGHQILLNVGNVDLSFQVSAALRFDRPTRTLFIRPTVTSLDQGGAQQNNDIGNLIVALFNDKELPVAIDELQPIITDIGSSMLIIDMQIDDITVAPRALTIHVLPDTRVENK